MRRITRTALLSAVGLLTLGAAGAAQAQYMVYGLAASGPGGAQQLVRFNSSNPTAITPVGLTGATLTGIDFRPANNVLYGYNGSAVFTIDLTTGAATQLPISAVIGGGNAGFDFNPAADAIRIIGASGTNLRYSFAMNTTFTDGALAYAVGDPGAGLAPNVTAAAYTNNDNDPATPTTLYGIDANRGTLVTVNPPNNGVLNTVGSLGLGSSVSNVTGFDVVTVGAANLAFFSTLTGGVSNFYSVNLTSGAATLVGAVGAGAGLAGGLQGLAIMPIPEPGTWALMGVGLAGLAGVARRRARRTAA